MKSGYAVASALAAFAAGALLVTAAAQASPMGSWSMSDLWAPCQGMMQATRPAP